MSTLKVIRGLINQDPQYTQYTQGNGDIPHCILLPTYDRIPLILEIHADPKTLLKNPKVLRYQEEIDALNYYNKKFNQ